MSQTWRCLKCKRVFRKKNQQHSCVVYPLAKHFKNKALAQNLFQYLKTKITTMVGPVKIESLPCCIHFVNGSTFGAVWAMKDRIRIDFLLDHRIKSRRLWKILRFSANRYLHYMEIKEKKEIDNELIGWIKESYHLQRY